MSCDDLVTETVDLRLRGHITLMQRYLNVRCHLTAKRFGLGEVIHHDIAGRNCAAFFHQLDAKFTPHTRAATCNNSNLALKTIHWLSLNQMLGLPP